jgi:hypothetical protein
MNVQASELKIIGDGIYWYLSIMAAVMTFVTTKFGLLNFEQLIINNFP